MNQAHAAVGIKVPINGNFLDAITEPASNKQRFHVKGHARECLPAEYIFRCGLVETRWKKARDLSKASVWKSGLWRHADDEPTREGAVKRLVKMLKGLIAEADAEDLKLAPFIGFACPGVINDDGSIAKGAQNLPGNWESSRFNLPASLVEAIPEIGGHDTAVLMHNDGVAQGLSEVPFMQDVDRWGVLTIGTGLGNARFSNRRKDKDDRDEKKEKSKD